MSRSPWKALVLVLPLGLGACFTVPAAPLGHLALDRALLGKWDCTSIDHPEASRAQLTVLQFDDRQYYAEWREGDKVDRFRAYPAKAKGTTFLNVGELEPSSQWPWTAVLPSIGGDGTLSLKLPSKRLLDMPDQTAAVVELRSTAAQPGTWQVLTSCVPHKDEALLHSRLTMD